MSPTIEQLIRSLPREITDPEALEETRKINFEMLHSTNFDSALLFGVYSGIFAASLTRDITTILGNLFLTPMVAATLYLPFLRRNNVQETINRTTADEMALAFYAGAILTTRLLSPESEATIRFGGSLGGAIGMFARNNADEIRNFSADLMENGPSQAVANLSSGFLQRASGFFGDFRESVLGYFRTPNPEAQDVEAQRLLPRNLAAGNSHDD